MRNKPLHTQLKRLRSLNEKDLSTLDGLLGRTREFDQGVELLAEGADASHIHVLETGWALRYKTLEDGRRQILNFLIPGDIFGFYSLLFDQTTYGVSALTPVSLHRFSARPTYDALRDSPQLTIALSWLAGHAERQLDEQIVRIGQRAAVERIAHLFIELHLRLIQAGLPQEVASSLPLTQTLLADTLGMSHIHVNRSFRKLALAGVVTRQNRHIRILEINKLRHMANFEVGYLRKEPIPAPTQKIFNNTG